MLVNGGRERIGAFLEMGWAGVRSAFGMVNLNLHMTELGFEFRTFSLFVKSSQPCLSFCGFLLLFFMVEGAVFILLYRKWGGRDFTLKVLWSNNQT